MSIIYNIIFIMFAFFYIPVFLLRKRKRKGVGLRFGIYPQWLIARLKSRKNIWIHAVSVGETIAVSSLAKNLKSRYPGHRLVISTVTETGNSVAERLAGDDGIAFFLPFDISFVIRRAIDYISPSILIIAETELWPNLIREAGIRGIPIVLVNGRISDRSYIGYACVKFLLAPLLNNITLFLMQTATDRKRITALGAPDSRVMISGNLKFDSSVTRDSSAADKDALYTSLGIKGGEKLIVAGSTHTGEEEAITRTFKDLKSSFRGLRLLIAPRHIERTSDVEGIIERYGFTPVRISQLSALSSQLSANTVFILDTIGQLKDFYSIADVVFVGGSLIRRGGQNIIEPAAFGKPVIFGPHTFNFKDITELFLEKEAALAVNDTESLGKALTRLLSDEDLCRRLGMRAKEIVDENRGAVDITMNELEKLITDSNK